MSEVIPVVKERIRTQEKRQFGVHPAIIWSLIKEQAGSVSKALAELVMNSIDAGATRIDMTIDQHSFTISDDGKGFSSRDEIDQFFEVFGTPHNEGDAYFGKFRIGRGQMMVFAKTVWRSGHFRMDVDLSGATEAGYVLTVLDQTVPGCVIKGEFYEEKYYFDGDYHYFSDQEYSLKSMVRYVPVPIYINGKLLNDLPSDINWSKEDTAAWYLVGSNEHELRIYNRGVFVTAFPGAVYGVTGDVVSKLPLALNMARNEIRRWECGTWKVINESLKNTFDQRLSRLKKLDHHEHRSLMKMIVSDQPFTADVVKNLAKIRFIPTIFGERITPKQLFSHHVFTLYDGHQAMIAERAQKMGLANVIMPEWMSLCDLERNDENLEFLMHRMAGVFHDYRIAPKIIPFAQFVKEMAGLHEFIEDTSLSTEEKLIMDCLRRFNGDIAWICQGSSSMKRELRVGVSNQMDAWTDGMTYIAIRRKQLNDIRINGPHVLVSLLVHEYCHESSSAQNHPHDREFYLKFHQKILNYRFAAIVNSVFRHYLSGLAKNKIVPSKDVGYHAKQIASIADKLPSRLLKNVSGDSE